MSVDHSSSNPVVEEGSHNNNNNNNSEAPPLVAFQQNIERLIEDPDEVTHRRGNNNINYNSARIPTTTHHPQGTTTGGSRRLLRKESALHSEPNPSAASFLAHSHYNNSSTFNNNNNSLYYSPSPARGEEGALYGGEEDTVLKPLPHTEFLLSELGSDGIPTTTTPPHSLSEKKETPTEFRTTAATMKATAILEKKAAPFSSQGDEDGSTRRGGVGKKERERLNAIKEHRKELKTFEGVLQQVEGDAQRMKRKYWQKKDTVSSHSSRYGGGKASVHEEDPEEEEDNEKRNPSEEEDDDDDTLFEENSADGLGGGGALMPSTAGAGGGLGGGMNQNSTMQQYNHTILKYNRDVGLALEEDYYQERQAEAGHTDRLDYTRWTPQDIEKQSELSWTKTRHLLVHHHDLSKAAATASTTSNQGKNANAFHKDSIRKGIYQYINESEKNLIASRVTRNKKPTKRKETMEASRNNHTNNNNEADQEEDYRARYVNPSEDYLFEGESPLPTTATTSSTPPQEEGESFDQFMEQLEWGKEAVYSALRSAPNSAAHRGDGSGSGHPLPDSRLDLSAPESPSMGTAQFNPNPTSLEAEKKKKKGNGKEGNTADGENGPLVPSSSSPLSAVPRGPTDDDDLLLMDFSEKAVLSDEMLYRFILQNENVLLSRLLLLGHGKTLARPRRRSLSTDDIHLLSTTKGKKTKGALAKHKKSPPPFTARVAPLPAIAGVSEKSGRLIQKELYDNERSELMAEHFTTKEFARTVQLMNELRPKRRELLEESLSTHRQGKANKKGTFEKTTASDPFEWERLYPVRTRSCPPLPLEDQQAAPGALTTTSTTATTTTQASIPAYTSTDILLAEKKELLFGELKEMDLMKKYTAKLKYLDLLLFLQKRHFNQLGSPPPSVHEPPSSLEEAQPSSTYLAVEAVIRDCREVITRLYGTTTKRSPPSPETLRQEFKAVLELHFNPENTASTQSGHSSGATEGTPLLSDFAVQHTLQQLSVLFYFPPSTFRALLSQLLERYQNTLYDYESIFRSIDKTIPHKTVSNEVTLRLTLHGVRNVPSVLLNPTTTASSSSPSSPPASSAALTEYYVQVRAESLLITSTPVGANQHPSMNPSHSTATHNSANSGTRNVSLFGQTFTLHLYDNNSIIYFYLFQKQAGESVLPLPVNRLPQQESSEGGEGGKTDPLRYNNKLAEGGFHVQANHNNKGNGNKTQLWLPLKGKNCYKTELKLTIEIIS